MSFGASLLPSTDTARGLPRSRDCGVDLGSEVYRMLREPAETLTSEPKQSGSFRYLQGMLEAGEGGKTPAILPHLPNHSLRCPEECRPAPAPLRPHPFLHPSHLPQPLLFQESHTPRGASVRIPTPPPSRLLPPPNLVPSRCAGSIPHREEVKFSFLTSAPGSCRLRSGFQGSGLGPAVPATSSPRPASWALR